MLVISDTSPLSALLLAGRESLLKQIFDRVVIPPAVERELLRAHAALPAWIEILSPPDISLSVSSGNGQKEKIDQ